MQASTFVILFGFGVKSKLTFSKFPFFANTQNVGRNYRKMELKRKIFILFIIAIVQSISAQNNVDEKQFQLMKPMLFEMNQKLFYENDFVTSTINPNYIPEWKKKIDLSNLDTIFNSIKKESLIELEEQNFEKQNIKYQNLKLIAKYKDEKNANLKFKIEIIENNLKDKNDSEIMFRNVIGLSNGNGFEDSLKENYLSFNIKNIANNSVKGKIKFKISFLTSYKVIKVNDFVKDSIFIFQNSKFKILSLKDNYIKFIGLDSLADKKAENIEYCNLDKNLKEVIPTSDENENSFNSMNSEIQISTPSSKVSFPSFLFDEKVKYMNFDEYSEYLDLNRKNKSDKIHYIKFTTKIKDLYFYEECYDEFREFEINVNQTINIKENGK